MRDATDIQLDQLIIHIINPRKPDGLKLSQRTLPLDEERNLTHYFTKHIQNSLQDSAIKAARFSALNDGVVAGVCKSLLHGSLDMVDGSKQLAEILHGIINSDGRISPGNLAIAIYQAGNYPGMHFLALLKIDPSNAFRPQIKEDSQGNKYVSFETTTDVMPTTRERLQKCGFIQPLDPRQDYDMMLLDRQVQQQVAQFFTRDFLGAELTFDDQKRTDVLYKSLMSASNKLRPQLTPKENETLCQAINYAVSSNSINIDDWLQALVLDDQHKDKINQIVSQRLPDRQFAIDTTYSQKLTRKRHFRGDYNLQVDILADEYDQVIQSVDLVPGQDGKPPYHSIVIHTEKWEEVP